MILNKVEKPARYTGGELNSVVKHSAELDFALCFPDVYEVGMSHVGIQILYELLNGMDGVYAQRVFCPWVDMLAEMRAAGEPLRSLETQKPLNEFGIVGFNLSYEMCYTNVLLMLELGGIPVHASARGETHPIVLGGGMCTVNPEPLADFFDLFVIGEAEEAAAELCTLYLEHKRTGWDRAAFIRAAVGIEGVYAPHLYDVTYNTDNTVRGVAPQQGAPAVVRRRFVAGFDTAPAVQKPVLPYINTVHDRCTLEIMRGCPNGCRFCQAGYYTRPVRERRMDTLLVQARNVIAATGYDEISLSSLSSGDHSQVGPLITTLMDEFSSQRVSVALPSMRANNFHFAQQLTQVRKTGFTFAPEAGTQRLRDVINKNITHAEILETMSRAFGSGAATVKLYFMMGLPTETMKDIEGIAALVRQIREVYYAVPKQQRGSGLSINVSVSCFVPKPCTPFQWEAQDSVDTFREKQQYLKEQLRMRGVRYSYHDARTSFLEAVLARGDRRLGDVLYTAHKNGAQFDAWQEQFHYDAYVQAFAEHGIDPTWYANRKRPFDEVLPYDNIDGLVQKAFLIRECEKAYTAATTPVCGEACAGCGLAGQGCKLVEADT